MLNNKSGRKAQSTKGGPTAAQLENRDTRKTLWRPRHTKITEGIAVLQALAEMGYKWEDLLDDELERAFWTLSFFVNDTRWLYIWIAREANRRKREKQRLEKSKGKDYV